MNFCPLVYIPDLDRWVRAGNVVLVEEQSTASIPIQQAYEPFTYDGINMQKTYPLTVERASRWEEDLSRTYRTLEDDGHPIVETTGETLSLGDASIYRKDWFPPQFTKDLASLDDYETLKQRMYIGWFDNYDDAWIPLVFADQERTRPTLLCRFVEGDDAVGAYVVSTMYLGAAEQTELVRNMLDIPEHGPGYLNRLEEESRERKRTILLRSALAVGTVIAVAVFILAYRLYGFTPTGLIGSMISGAVSALVYVSVERRLSAR